VRSVLTVLISTAQVGVSVWAQKTSTTAIRFEDFRVTQIFSGKPSPPILGTPEQRRYRTRIRDGVLKGDGVWADSESKRWLTKPESNFAGNLVVIMWGCGTQCVMMAVIDRTTGKVYDPPLSGAGTQLYVPLDNQSEMKTEFRPDSSLMVLRDACRDFKQRSTCGTYYFNWKDNRFDLVKFVMADPIQGRVP
jgi:hypothetical protein